MDYSIYKGKNVMVTGCCGFKGSWLVCWLKKLGANVIQIGHLPKTTPNHFYLLGGKVEDIALVDLSCYDERTNFLANILKYHKIDVVFHLAAHAIVSKTFEDPAEAISNNTMAALSVLEACRQSPVKGVVLITTDKVYQDKNWIWGYREVDELGGFDPYSTSKVCIEHIVECYRRSFGGNIAVARAGNVIGGGDWSLNRLIPDLIKAAVKGETVDIHTPSATRPWQHVLDALNGYILLGKEIMLSKDVNTSWNFGPAEEVPVGQILLWAQNEWKNIVWEVDNQPTHEHMVHLLKIDSTKAHKLGWEPRWSIETAVRRTIAWYRAYYEQGVAVTGLDLLAYRQPKRL